MNLVELKRVIYRLGCYRRGFYGCVYLWVEGGFERVEVGKREVYWEMKGILTRIA